MLELSAPQDIFLNKLNTKFRAYCGGYGSGKTYIGCLDLALFSLKHPKVPQGYFGPTYPSIRDIFYPTFEEAAFSLDIKCMIKTSDKEVHLYRGGRYCGVIIARSMDRPQSIIGFKIARALVDEIDTLAKDKATDAWRKIIARLRYTIDGVENGVGVTTTPEGFLFVYDTFGDNPKPSYSMVQASTYENEQYLPEDYISSLIETYPQELINAYVNGEFVNLRSGTVIYAFNRKTCVSRETVQEKEPLYIGMDFNVENMAAAIYVVRDDAWHQVGEAVKIFDTPGMINFLKNKYPEHHITVYPDASGASRKSVNASQSDIDLLRQAGFSVSVNKKNPLIKDRVLSANSAFQHGHVKVNIELCPTTVKCYEQLAYDSNGEPDKKSGFDHSVDAGTYPIVYEFPIRKPITHIPITFSS
jgi:hypothetical protein